VPRANDLGGLRALGPVEVEPDEPVFHADWERRVFGIMLAAGRKGFYTDNQFRNAAESIHPLGYVNARYYARWLWAIERLLVEQGVLTEDELEGRTREVALHPERPTPRREEPEFAEQLLEAVYQGVSQRRDVDGPRRFHVGDRVVARGSGTDGHTRLPAYALGRTGVIVRCDDAFVLADSDARREGENPQWLYGVRFEADELWGADAEARAPVCLDLWECYLEPAE
jgi:nitrile hydratase beta subunit